MSPTRDSGRGSPTSRDLCVSLTFEQDRAAMLVAHLAVEEPDGWLVELDLTGDELARLLAGETVTVAGEVSGIEEVRDEEPEVELDTVEPEAVAEEAEHEPAGVEQPTPIATAGYSTSLDEPPAGTGPITRSTDVAPGEAVVAYIRGRWQDAVVARRDIGSLLLSYSRPGPFGQVQARIATDRVRRRT
jgi:hypothetical protein